MGLMRVRTKLYMPHFDNILCVFCNLNSSISSPLEVLSLGVSSVFFKMCYCVTVYPRNSGRSFNIPVIMGKRRTPDSIIH